MGYLKRMALEQGQVVIASIHQPRSAIWQMFDAATLLASGRLMYHGPRDGLTPWFEGLGYGYGPSLHGVPSDWWVLCEVSALLPERSCFHTLQPSQACMKHTGKVRHGNAWPNRAFVHAHLTKSYALMRSHRFQGPGPGGDRLCQARAVLWQHHLDARGADISGRRLQGGGARTASSVGAAACRRAL